MIAFRFLRRAVLPGMMALALMSSAAVAQKSYSTPEDAASALAAAVKSGPSDVLKVLGRAADDIVSSGDEIADTDARARFTSMYDAKHAIKAAGNKAATLMLGQDDFPFPIPLVNTKDGWRFDTAEGRKEVLYRRIGRNELDAIQTSLAYVDAQGDYADKDRGEGKGVYAQRIVSSPGKKDGLFWRDDGDPSPLGALAAGRRSRTRAVSRLLLPHPEGAGLRRPRRRAQLRRQRQDDRRVCADRLARGVWQFRRDDLRGQP